MHFFSTIMVATGALFSSVWIVIANSWQQAPAGFHVVDDGLAARAEIVDFWAMVFNPSAMHRLIHVWIGAFVFLLGMAIFPNLVPSSVDPAYSLNIYNAASSQKTLGIMAVIAAIGMPIVVTYTAIVYWTFRGKVKLGEFSY